MGTVIGTVITGFIQLAFLEYAWLYNGGDVTDLVVLIIRVFMGAIFFGVIGKIAIDTIGGRL